MTEIDKVKTVKDTDRSKKRTQAYNAAESRLRENHQDEFQKLMAEECAKRGLDYKPKLSPEQKAAQAVAALLEEFPGLRENVRSLVAVEPVEEPEAAEPKAVRL